MIWFDTSADKCNEFTKNKNIKYKYGRYVGLAVSKYMVALLENPYSDGRGTALAATSSKRSWIMIDAASIVLAGYG